MAEIKIVVNDVKTGKSYQRTTDSLFQGRHIGETVKGDEIGLKDYELKITGGSDSSGFPMRKELQTSGRKKIFIKDKKGTKRTKTVRGNIISDQTTQLSLAVIKYGSKPITELWNIQEKPKEETKEIKEKKETKTKK